MKKFDKRFYFCIDFLYFFIFKMLYSNQKRKTTEGGLNDVFQKKFLLGRSYRILSN